MRRQFACWDAVAIVNAEHRLSVGITEAGTFVAFSPLALRRNANLNIWFRTFGELYSIHHCTFGESTVTEFPQRAQ
jgi:hypothetical protein